MHTDRAILVQRDPTTVECLDSAQVIKAHGAVVLRLDDWLLESLAGSAADVECAHRQLRSRLSNRLGRNNAYCFTELNELARSQVAPVTHRAYASPALTG